MAKVPDPLAPDRLPSEAVGVPSIDTSGAAVGKELSENISNINEVRYKRQLLADSITVNSARNSLDVQLRSMRNTNNKSFYDAQDENGRPIIATPEQEQDTFLKQAYTARDTMAKSMSTPQQKNLFATESLALIKSHQDEAYNQALTRQSSQVHVSTLTGLNTIAGSNHDVFADPNTSYDQKIGEMSNLMDQAGTTLKLAQKYLPATEVNKLRDNFAKQFAKGAIFGAMDNNPDLAMQMMKDGLFSNHLTVQEQTTLERYAAAELKRKDEQAALNLPYAQNVTTQKLWQGIHSGTTRMDDIETAYQAGKGGDPNGIQQPDYKALTNLLFSKKILDVTEKDDVYNNLMDEQNRLFQTNDKGVSPTKEATLASISLLRQHVMEAERVGALSRARANSFKRATTPSLDESAIADIRDSVLNRKSGFEFFGHWVGDHKIGTPAEEQTAKATLTHELSKQIDDAEAQGQKLTPGDVKIMGQNILKDYLTRQYPQTMNSNGVPNMNITQAGGPQSLHAIVTPPTTGQKVSQPTKAQFKTGDEQEKDGQTWVRGDDGKWRPKKS